MIGRYRVAIGDVQMDSLSDDLLILDVGFSAPDFQINQNKSANLDGYDFVNQYYEKQSVTITFELHIYDIAKRNEACQKVNKWASSGLALTVNERKDQRLMFTRCEKFASIESSKSWTAPLTITISSTFLPYWQSVTTKTATIVGSGSSVLKLDGNTSNALVSVEATAGTDVSSYKIEVGSTIIDFVKTLSLKPNDKLVIDYVDGRFLRIRQNGESALSKMDGASSDCLLAACGTNTTVKVKANGKITTVVSARGLWL